MALWKCVKPGILEGRPLATAGNIWSIQLKAPVRWRYLFHTLTEVIQLQFRRLFQEGLSTRNMKYPRISSLRTGFDASLQFCRMVRWYTLNAMSQSLIHRWERWYFRCKLVPLHGLSTAGYPSTTRTSHCFNSMLSPGLAVHLYFCLVRASQPTPTSQ